MAEMREFEDLEARLRAHSLAEPPTEGEQALREAGASLVAMQRRRSRWLLAAAAALVFALNLATERYMASRTAAETPWPPPAAPVGEYREVLASLNGLAAEWPKWQALLSIQPRTPRLRPIAPANLLKELER